MHDSNFYVHVPREKINKSKLNQRAKLSSKWMRKHNHTKTLWPQVRSYQIKRMPEKQSERVKVVSTRVQTCIIKYKSYDWVNELIVGNVHNAQCTLCVCIKTLQPVQAGANSFLAQNTLAHTHELGTWKASRTRKYNETRKPALAFIMIAKMEIAT